MASKPEPPVPPFVDLRTFDDMPLNVVRLLNSDILFETTGDEFKAAVLLWARAWHQVPAGSLPADDTKLAYMAGLGRDQKGWKKVKAGALRGFIECSDGRLYHEVICEAALKSWGKKTSGKEGADARWKGVKSLENNNSRDANPSGTANGTYNKCADDLPSGESHGETMPRTELNRTDKESPLPPKGDDEVFGQVFDTRFWPAYPSRGQAANPKKPARLKFIAACKRGEDSEAIIAGVKAYAANPSTKVGTEFVATALVWLTQERWKDYAPAAAAIPGAAAPPADQNELELRAKFWFGRRMGTKETDPWRPKLPHERKWPFPGKPPFHEGSEIPREVARKVCRDLGIDPEVEERSARTATPAAPPSGARGPGQRGAAA